MPMTDPFLNPAFSVASLSKSIMALPPMPTKIDQSGLMPARGVRTRVVLVEEQNGVVTLLKTMPVGAPGTPARTGKRIVRSFIMPHIPHEDAIFPADVDGLRAFGQENTLQPLAQLVNDRQQTMRNKHDVTLEHLRVGALAGVILDADGSTLYDLFDEFGIPGVTSYTDPLTNYRTRLEIDFALGTDTTDVLALCRDVSRHMECNLSGEAASGVMVYVDGAFFDALGAHPQVKDAYARYQDGDALRSDYRTGFRFGGLTFVEYEGAVSDSEGNVRTFIPAGEGIAFPMGSVSTFVTYFAPGDFNEAAGTPGQRLYSKIEARKFGRGWDLHTQSNPLPMCHRPALLVRIHTSN